MKTILTSAHFQPVTQAFANSSFEAPADPVANVTSQLFAFFRSQGCVLTVAEELAERVAGELRTRVRQVLRRPGLDGSWISGVIQIGDLKLDLRRSIDARETAAISLGARVWWR